MAKMFYTLEEAAEKLKVEVEQVKSLATEGQLQQFRDRDKLMFKRDEVDALSENMPAIKSSGDSTGGPIDLASSTGSIPMDVMDDTAEISVDDSTTGSKAGSAAGSSFGTGVSVFEAGEIEPADPSAQTQVVGTGSGISSDAELSLESIGSGSGLLDLTHERDDTSLGVQIDEIMPQDTSQSSAMSGTAESPAAASAILEEIASEGPTADQEAATAVPLGAIPDYYDPAESGLLAGLLGGAFISLVMVLLAAVSGMTGSEVGVISGMASSMGSLLLWSGVFLLVSAALGAVGWVVGKKTA
ncbi:MAG: helix-turn-helix domain-containing protein [Phycisphaeraceae bacterium]|nr:helix-turn-helix domain-containing protein [Phycisphaeraceae bacterium]